VNDLNDESATPLVMLLTLRGNNFPQVETLLKYGAKPEIPDRDHIAPLHLAAEFSNVEICRAFLKYDEVDVNIKDDLSGESPLHWAFRGVFPPTELLELLIEKGAGNVSFY
jgi:ankyrin repeat protein